MNRQEQINQVLNNFDFKLVQDVMRLRPSEWWKGVSGDVPTVEELRATARHLLEKAAEPSIEYDSSHISSGGFHAMRFPWTMSDGTDCTMELVFAAGNDYA